MFFYQIMYKFELVKLFKVARSFIINANNYDEIAIANTFVEQLDKILFDNHINDDYFKFSLNQLKLELKDKNYIKSRL